MVGLTVLMHFQQLEDVKFQIFPGGQHPPDPLLRPLCLPNLLEVDLSFQHYLVPVLEVSKKYQERF